MPVDGQPGADKAAFSKASWLNPTAATSTDFAELQLQRLRDEGFGIDVCTQHAGDLLFVPGLWHHATVNLGETVALAWRERFIESPLSVAAEKHRARLDRGAVAGRRARTGCRTPAPRRGWSLTCERRQTRGCSLPSANVASTASLSS